MLNAEQFRSAVQRFAPQNESQLLNANTDWFDRSTGPGSARSTTPPSRARARARTIGYRLNFLDQNGILDKSSVQADRPGGELQPAARQRPAQSALQPERLPLGRQIHAVWGARQRRGDGADQPVFDPNAPTGFYDWPGGPDTLRTTRWPS